MITFFGLANMLGATELITFFGQRACLAMFHRIHPPRARQHSSSFCVCRPNMVALLKKGHVRNVENARGWSFVLKNSFFLKLDFVVSYYYRTKVI